MSAAAHRQEAARERGEARELLLNHGRQVAAFDRVVPGGYAGVLPAEEARPGGLVHRGGGMPDLWAAEAHADHAKLHDAAAAELERLQEEACAGLSDEERASCPLLRGAALVIDVKGGAEVRFRYRAPIDDVERRMRCHFAFAQAHGFDEAAACPLYTRGLRIQREGDRVLRITADGDQAADAIRARTRDLVPGT